jgi:signal transduction histidine kinase
VWESGERIVVWKLKDDPLVEGIITADDGLSSAMVVPVKTDKGVLGALGVLTRTPHFFTKHEAELLEGIANHVCLALVKAQAEDQQRRLAEQQTAMSILEPLGIVGGVLAHDVASFLGAIGATASMLHNRIRSLDPVDIGLLQNLRDHGHTADRLVQQLRGMKEVMSQEHPVEAISLQHVAMDVLQLIQLPLAISLECKYFDHLPMVRANRVLLHKILNGVIQNALEAMPAGGTLRLLAEISVDQSAVLLYISNTGQGIPPKIRENLFKPFFSTKPHGGLGLGLWLSRLYLRTIRGDIINQWC